MGLLFRLAELLIILVPLVGIVVAAVKAFAAANRARTDRLDPPAAPRGDAQSAAATNGAGGHAARWRAITRVIDEHARTDTRWLDYELDAAKLLDFPLMTDMRDPLTTAFHRAKLRADLLRPAKAEDLLDDGDAADRYLAAVEDYATALDVAEAEAIRRRRNDFSRADQQRMARAQSLLRVAADAAATPQERERAYTLAGRELDGLVVLPPTTRAALERGIAGEIDG